MPELPDVENYKRFLDSTALHKKIERAKVGDARILQGISGRKLAHALRGRKLKSSRRHGKHLFAEVDGGNWLALHFGMTGRFEYFKDLGDDPKHDRLRLDLANGHHLAFVNQRLFGKVELTDNPDAYIDKARLGPDSLDKELDEKAFRERLGGRGGQLKSALMNQSLLAGIGNVYSDEILFQARLHPKTKVDDLSGKQLSTLYRAMRRVLEMAIERGAGSEKLFERLPKTWLLARREAGAECPRCGGKVKTIKAAGRTAYYCPKCQSEP